MKIGEKPVASYNNIQSKELFTEKEKEYFLRNIFYEQGFDSSFLYRGKGAEIFSDITESEYSTHYMIEKKLLHENREKLQTFIGKNVTDFGCGDGEKAALLLEKIPTPFQYIAADYSPDMLHIAEERLSKNWNAKIGQNFLLNGKRFTLGKEISDNTYLWFGETMCNFNDGKIVEYLRDMGNTNYVKGNRIMFSFESPPQDEEAKQKRLERYKNPLGEEFVMNGLEQLGLNREDFSYTVNQNSDGLIHVGITAKKDQIIQIGNREITIHTGNFFPIHQNRTFTKEKLAELLQKANCKKEFLVDRDGVGLMVVQKTAEKWEKYGSKIRKALIGILLVSTGIGIKTGIDIQRTNREITAVKKELVKGKDYKDYGLGLGNAADFLDDTKELQNRVEQQSNSLFNEMMIIYRNSNIKDKQSILYLLQTELLNKQSDGNYIDFTKLENDPTYKFVFLKNFLEHYRVMLANFGVNSLTPYADILMYSADFEKILQIEGELKGPMLTINDRSSPIGTMGWGFNANEENTTLFSKLEYPETIKSLLKDTVRENVPENQVLINQVMRNFEDYRNGFDFLRDGGKYRHSDGRLFQVIFVSKYMNSLDHRTSNIRFLLAADITDKKTEDMHAKHYSLSNGKEVIKDIQKNWLE